MVNFNVTYKLSLTGCKQQSGCIDKDANVDSKAFHID